MPTSALITVALISLAAVFLIASGIRRKPGLGIALTVILIVISARLGETSLAQMGLVQPDDWLTTVLLGVFLGGGLSLLSIMLIGPLIEHITRQPHDVSVVAGVRGNWKALLSWLILVWGMAALGEEVLFRGFLMSQIIKLLGTSFLALLLNVLVTSIIFGLSHSYQGRSGAWSTGIIGACLGVIYVMNGFNLWLPILVHGVIDTVALILISLGADKRLKELVWKKPRQAAG
jgi:membrane protease YdiL (CAAX protease family)